MSINLSNMKKLIFLIPIMLWSLALYGQTKEKQPSDSMYVCTCENTFVFNELTEVITNLSSGTIVKVIGPDIDSVGKHYKIKTPRNVIGYIAINCLRPYSEVLKEKRELAKKRAIEKKVLAKKQEEIKQKQENERKALISYLTTKYGAATATKILNNEVWLGMTKEMVLDSRGKPSDINRSVGSWGVNEQWVYGDQYLYFENGKLTSWQD